MAEREAGAAEVQAEARVPPRPPDCRCRQFRCLRPARDLEA